METETAKEKGKKKAKKEAPHAYELMPSKAPLELLCEWGDCDEFFSNMNEFRSHVQNHLWDLFHTVKGTDNECESFVNIACDWKQCDSDCGRGFSELVRHVYFHAFHTRLKSVGNYIVQVRKAPLCKLEDTSRNVIPELPEQLICHWDNCGTVYDDPSLFYEHCNSHIEELPSSKHPPGGVKCKWEGCEQSVQNRHRMREHIRSHTQERIVACATCGTLFANNTKLLDHLLRQKDISDGFQCSHCNKAFSTERLLRDHMRNHVNHYKCPLCEMTCPSPANLRTHLSTRHSEERPHSCSYCSRSYKLAGDLRKHLETHSESTFACNIGDCKFTCVSYKLLLLHFKKEHEGGIEKRRYRCHLCQLEYTRGGLLTNHLRRVHSFQWPPGHQRFRYRPNSEGIYQLQTVRYESLEMYTDDVNGENGPEEGGHKTPGKDKRTRIRMVRAAELKTLPDPDESIQDNDGQGGRDYSYNLEMLGDVALQQGSSRGGKAATRARPGGSGDHNPQVDKTGTTAFEIMPSTGKRGNKYGLHQDGLVNAKRKLCMDLNDASTSSKTTRSKKRVPKKSASNTGTGAPKQSGGRQKNSRKQVKKRDLSEIINNLTEEKKLTTDGETTPKKLTPHYSGYADEVSCTDSNATIHATTSEEGGMELTWTSDCHQNLEISLPESFSDCEAVSVSYNGQERTVPIMNMPVVIFGDELHHRKQRTPVKVIAHDKL